MRNESRIPRVSQVSLIALAVLLALFGLAWLFLPTAASNPSAQRATQRGVTFMGSTVPVQVQLADVPLSPCPNAPVRSFDIVLLLDISSSMQGNAIAQEMAAAERFLEVAELGRNQVGLVFFQGSIVSQSPLSTDKASLVAAVRRAVAGDGTAIDTAINAGLAEVTGPRRRPSVGGLLILFSDGGSDRNLAVAAAQAAWAKKVPIVSVGLYGQAGSTTGLDADLLRDLATSGIFRIAQAPEDLVGIYSDLGLQLGQTVATDFSVIEPVAPEFSVVALPAGALPDTQRGGFVYSRPFITSTRGAGVAYDVAPTRIGWLDVVSGTSSVNLLDCAGQPVAISLPDGPRVLVLPPLWLVLLPLFGLLALGVVPILLMRKPALPPQPSPGPITPIARSNVSPFRNWLADAARNWASEDELSRPGWLRERPVVFVGLGAAGQVVLDNLATYMSGRVGHNWEQRASNVRMLAVSVSEEDKKPSGTDKQRSNALSRLVVSFNKDRKQHAALDAPQFNWFDKNLLARPGRALGRLAVFDNLQDGTTGSQLLRALGYTMRELDNAAVYVVSDAFSDDASSMIADVAHLLRAGHGRQIGYLGLCLATQNANWPGNLTLARRSERVMATLREIQRLQRRSRVLWSYAPSLTNSPILNAESDNSLFDEILLFDGKGENQFDLSEQSASDGLLAMLSGCLIAMLDKDTNTAVETNRANQLTAPIVSGNVPAEQVIGTMGTFAIRLPVDEMRRIATARVLHGYLFDLDSGKLPRERLNAQGEPDQRGKATIPVIAANTIPDFMRDYSVIAGRIEPADLRGKVCDYLESQLNHAETPRNMRWCAAFMAQLGQMPGLDGSVLGSIQAALGEWLVAAGDAPGSVAKPVAAVRPGASSVKNDWAAAAKARSGRASVGSREDVDRPESASNEAVPDAALYAAWQEEWKNSREVLERAARLRSQSLLWSVADEHKLYQDLVARDKPWKRIPGRVWWSWIDTGSTPSLGMLVLPSEDLDAPDPDTPILTRRKRIEMGGAAQFSVGPKKAADLMTRLIQTTQPLTRGIGDAALRVPLDEKPADELARELERNSSALLARRQLPGWAIPVRAFRYMVRAANIKPAEAIADAIRTMVGQGSDRPVQDVTTVDRTEFRLLHIKHALPLHASDVFASANTAYVNPRPDLHVWPAERLATQWEDRARKRLRFESRSVAQGGTGAVFSPYFVELIEKYDELLRLFGLALLYGGLRFDGDPSRLILSTSSPLADLFDYEQARVLFGAKLDAAAAMFCKVCAEDKLRRIALAERIQSRRVNLGETVFDYRDQVRSEIVDPLLNPVQRAASAAPQTDLLGKLAATQIAQEASSSQVTGFTDRLLATDVALLLAMTIFDEDNLTPAA